MVSPILVFTCYIFIGRSKKNNIENVASSLPCTSSHSTIERPSMSVTCPKCDAVFSTVAAVQTHFAHCGQQSSAVNQSAAISDVSNQSFSSVTGARRRSSPEHRQAMSNGKATCGFNESRRQSLPQCQSTTTIHPAPNGSPNGPSELTSQLSPEYPISNSSLKQSPGADSCQLMGESSQAVVCGGVSGYCPICGPASQPMSPQSLVMHQRRQHDLYMCIRCYSQFAGEDRLEDHINTVSGLGSLNQQNSVCMPVAHPNVKMLCKYCPYGEHGNNYQTYLCLVRHIRSLHPGSVSLASRSKEGEIDVEVQSSKRRPLTSSEISLMLMQSSSNKSKEGSTDNVGAAIERVPPVKRRRVAIKSTARPTASQPIKTVAPELPTKNELQCLVSTSGSEG